VLVVLSVLLVELGVVVPETTLGTVAAVGPVTGVIAMMTP
jgi:hypothetical protein